MKIRQRIEQLADELSWDSGAWGASVEHDLALLNYEVTRAVWEYKTSNPSPGADVERAYEHAMEAEYAPPEEAVLCTEHEGGPRYREGEIVEVLGDRYQVVSSQWDGQRRKTKVELRRTWLVAKKGKKS